MKVYTKSGDKGKTGLIGGTRVPKFALRIDAYGTVDELNAHIGLLRDHAISATYKMEFLFIQDRLFTIGSWLASDPVKGKMQLPEIKEADVLMLENSIDQMDTLLEPMRSFVLPGGHETVSFCHIARTVCRRAERVVTHLHAEEPVNPLILAYINRLSDYLFVYGRLATKELKAEEIPWKPNLEG